MHEPNIVLLLLLMPPDRRSRQVKTLEIHRGKELAVGLSLSLALSTIQTTAILTKDLTPKIPSKREKEKDTLGPAFNLRRVRRITTKRCPLHLSPTPPLPPTPNLLRNVLKSGGLEGAGGPHSIKPPSNGWQFARFRFRSLIKVK
ncbi:hypothetical protein TNCV_2450961 [Trichonephila clavipes]|nr:hypothetical protein TNCV_2450961 [Trichonephila clavipes]